MKEMCKGCHGDLHPDAIQNAISRYGWGSICGRCGERESFEGDFIRTTIAGQSQKVQMQR